MATPLTNTFTRYSLTDQESAVGNLLSPEQVYVIQNRIADIAEQKLALEVDPNDTIKFVQNESFLAGQLAFARFILESNESIRALMRESESAP